MAAKRQAACRGSPEAADAAEVPLVKLGGGGVEGAEWDFGDTALANLSEWTPAKAVRRGARGRTWRHLGAGTPANHVKNSFSTLSALTADVEEPLQPPTPITSYTGLGPTTLITSYTGQGPTPSTTPRVASSRAKPHKQLECERLRERQQQQVQQRQQQQQTKTQNSFSPLSALTTDAEEPLAATPAEHAEVLALALANAVGQGDWAQAESLKAAISAQHGAKGLA